MLGAHDVEFGLAGTVALNLALFGLLAWGMWKIDSRIESGKTLLSLALVASFCIGGRVLLEPLPNISPVTVMLLIAGAHFGARNGVALAVIVAVVSNLFLGHGLWTLYQALGWSLVAVAGSYMATWLLDSERQISIQRLMMAGFVAGFAFDWFVSLSVLHTQSASYLLPYLAQGLVYDLIHAFGNVAFAAWLGTSVSVSLGRHAEIGMEARSDVTASV